MSVFPETVFAIVWVNDEYDESAAAREAGSVGLIPAV